MEAGRRVFTIEWGRNATADGKYTIYDALREADVGEATSVEGTIDYLVTYLCVILCIVNTCVRAFMDTDNKRKVGQVVHRPRRRSLGACTKGSTVRLGPR